MAMHPSHTQLFALRFWQVRPSKTSRKFLGFPQVSMFHWGCPKIGIPQNGWFIKGNPIQMEDLGVPPCTPLYGDPHYYSWSSDPFYLCRFSKKKHEHIIWHVGWRVGRPGTSVRCPAELQGATRGAGLTCPHQRMRPGGTQQGVDMSIIQQTSGKNMIWSCLINLVDGFYILFSSFSRLQTQLAVRNLFVLSALHLQKETACQLIEPLLISSLKKHLNHKPLTLHMPLGQFF